MAVSTSISNKKLPLKVVHFVLFLFINSLPFNDAARLPIGAAIWFESADCPPGWTEIVDSRGRSVIPTTENTGIGTQVGDALQNNEDPVHSHAVTEMKATLGFDALSSGIAVCLGPCSGASLGDPDEELTATNQASITSSSSGLAFVQLSLCKLETRNIDLSVPEETLVLFDSSITVCPQDFEQFIDASGRFLVAASDAAVAAKTDGQLLSSSMTSINTANPSVEQHSHPQDTTISTQCKKYREAEGVIFFDAAKTRPISNPVQFTGTTSSSSLNVPFLQLLACKAITGQETAKPPLHGLLYTMKNSCDSSWEKVDEDLHGRIFVGNPLGGTNRSLFGTVDGLPLAITGNDTPISHNHAISGIEMTLSTRRRSEEPAVECNGPTPTPTYTRIFAEPGLYTKDQYFVSGNDVSNIPYSVARMCTPNPIVLLSSCNLQCYFEAFEQSRGWLSIEEAKEFYLNQGYYNGDDCSFCSPTASPTTKPTSNPTMPTIFSPDNPNPNPSSKPDTSSLKYIVGSGLGLIALIGLAFYSYTSYESYRNKKFVKWYENKKARDGAHSADENKGREVITIPDGYSEIAPSNFTLFTRAPTPSKSPLYVPKVRSKPSGDALSDLESNVDIGKKEDSVFAQDSALEAKHEFVAQNVGELTVRPGIKLISMGKVNQDWVMCWDVAAQKGGRVPVSYLKSRKVSF